MARYFFSVFVFALILGCMGQEGPQAKKIYGVSFVASRDTIGQEHIDPLLELGATHAAVMPFGFIRDVTNPELVFNMDRQWFGETRPGARQYIQQLHLNGIQVMMKPHIWIGRGTFTGDLLMETVADWQSFEKGYTDFILLYAKLAEEENVEILCLGTELHNFLNARTLYWEGLIAEVRKVYSGKLTYAENWDKVGRVPFWDKLDYIGVDAYFPVSDMQTPSVEQARQGWHVHKKELAALSRKRDRPILFTEYGYRSIDFAGREPWHTDRLEGGANLDAQLNLTQALFEEFYDEPWFAGGFIWKWFHEHEQVGGVDNNRFTPQNKPTETYLKERFRS